MQGEKQQFFIKGKHMKILLSTSQDFNMDIKIYIQHQYYLLTKILNTSV